MHAAPRVYGFVLIVVLLSFAQNAYGARWSSFALQTAKTGQVQLGKPIGIAQENSGDYIIAIDTPSSTPTLCKANEFGRVTWSVQSKQIRGTVFSLALNRKDGWAYVLVSSSTDQRSPFSNGHVLRFSNISAGSEINAEDTIVEDLIFSTNSTGANAKLFGSVVDPSSGDLYLTGGTSGSLYAESNGRSDVIVVRISSTGKLLASAQFGTETDEFGRALDISSDSSVVVIAVQMETVGSGVESVLYRLNALTLEEAETEASLQSFESTPLFIPSSISVSFPLEAEPNTQTVAMTGTALTVPDRRLDMFFHLFATIGDSYSNSPIYLDGVANGRADDFGMDVQCGVDGNIYGIGYTDVTGPVNAKALMLSVVSPSGKLIYVNSREISEIFSSTEVPTAMTLISSGSRIIAVYTGFTTVENEKHAVIGFAVPPSGKISPFTGFGGIVEEAGIDLPSATPNGQVEEERNQISILAIIGGVCAAVGLILFAAIVISFQLRKKKAVAAPVVIEKGVGKMVYVQGVSPSPNGQSRMGHATQHATLV